MRPEPKHLRLKQAHFLYIAREGFQPGDRYWTREVTDRWVERYPSGFSTTFNINERIHVDGCNGALITSQRDSTLQLFVPDRDCEQMVIKFRRRSTNWVVRVLRTDLKWHDLSEMNDINRERKSDSEPHPPCIALAGNPLLGHCSPRTLSMAEERALKPGDVFRECVSCPEMVVIPSGSFTMGSASEAAAMNERPEHNVIFSRTFAVSKYHVTVASFEAFVNDRIYNSGSKCVTFESGQTAERNGRSWKDPGFFQGPQHPAVCLNWYDAREFAAWIKSKTGRNYRLLTEAEWEYSARAQSAPGPTKRFSFGDEEEALCEYGNVADQAGASVLTFPLGIAKCNDRFVYTSPVGTYKANKFGLFDMQGNAWQWVEDCYEPGYQSAQRAGDVPVLQTGCKFRIRRGGSWFSPPDYARAGKRTPVQPEIRNDVGGARLARTLEQ